MINNNINNEDIIKFNYFVYEITKLNNKIIELENNRDISYRQNIFYYNTILKKDDEILLLKEQNRNLLVELENLKNENIELKNIIDKQKLRIDYLEKELANKTINYKKRK